MRPLLELLSNLHRYRAVRRASDRWFPAISPLGMRSRAAKARTRFRSVPLRDCDLSGKNKNPSYIGSDNYDLGINLEL